MTDLKCRYCRQPWAVAAMTACPASQDGRHEFARTMQEAQCTTTP